MILTSVYQLKKAEDTDNADLKIFVNDNMDIIEAELIKRVTKDANGKVSETDLPIATTVNLGVIKVGSGLSVDPDGTLNATGGGGSNGVFGNYTIQYNATTNTLDFVYTGA